jgi:hypothetical protein
MTDGTKCKRPRQRGEKLCKRHVNLEAKRARVLALEDIWTDAEERLWEALEPPASMMDYLIHRLDEFGATPLEHEILEERAIEELDFYFTIHPAVGEGPGEPRTELEALTRDAQNVHTPAVNKQTAEGVTALLETPVALGQDTIAELKVAWKTYPAASRKSVLKDVRRWYTTDTCRVEGDFFYRALLDGLWTRIKLSPHKDDLVQRLWEEALEAIGVCSEGHVSRLCNVLVGYDASFKAPISAGEMLQQRIAAIAGEDISLPLKVVKAWETMEELQIPREQRMEWIEAF